jgi:hypothetical protein
MPGSSYLLVLRYLNFVFSTINVILYTGSELCET